MRKMILVSYVSLLFLFLMALFFRTEDTPSPPPAVQETEAAPAEAPPAPVENGEDAPASVRLLRGGETEAVPMQEYLIGVVAAEMPASFAPDALKAQAVAARTYAIYCMNSRRHENADVCADSACCQAWISSETMKKNWGDSFEERLSRISDAVSETEGEYLCYDGKAVFAAFHSSSAGKTEASGEIWSSLPYLVSVDSPESADSVPNFESVADISPLDFRDTILYAHPDADFTGEEQSWVGEITRDDSGRVKRAIIGDAELSGTELRKLFSLRSTCFTLEYCEGLFRFKVLGFGHGVGMSQYGAQVMAESGVSFRDILAHYYPGTTLVR